MDPRYAGIERRMRGVGRVLAVTGGKGGTGKSTVAATLALLLAELRVQAALLDLDLTAPTAHVILGAEGCPPTEEFGLVPPVVHGIQFMSVSHFLGGSPAPLRGVDVANALIELLAITCWRAVDVLVIDMPPGLGDASLELARVLRRVEYVVVAGGSPVVIETVRRMLRFLTDLRVPVVGVVENMARAEPVAGERLARQFGVPFLGSVPFDPALEAATGDAGRLGRTATATALRAVRDQLFPPLS